jgi:hypothetical protein
MQIWRNMNLLITYKFRISTLIQADILCIISSHKVIRCNLRKLLLYLISNQNRKASKSISFL